MKDLISRKKLLKELQDECFLSFEREDSGERMIAVASVEQIVANLKTESVKRVSSERLVELLKLEARVEAAIDYAASERFADVERMLRIIGTDKAIAAIDELAPKNVRM